MYSNKYPVTIGASAFDEVVATLFVVVTGVVEVIDRDVLDGALERMPVPLLHP